MYQFLYGLLRTVNTGHLNQPIEVFDFITCKDDRQHSLVFARNMLVVFRT